MSFLQSIFGKQTKNQELIDVEKPKRKTPKEKVDAFAEELKGALLAAGKDSKGQVLGVNLGEKVEYQRQIDDLVKNIKTSYSSYSKELFRSFAGWHVAG